MADGMDQALTTHRRRSERSNVMLKATLQTVEASKPVILRNLSEDGALVTGDELPAEGTWVLFHRQGLSVPSRIAWVHSNHAGLAFESPLFPKELLRHIPPPGHRPPPAIKRRPGLAPRPLSESERRMIEQWAAESPYALGD
jgi:hypothetical protein